MNISASTLTSLPAVEANSKTSAADLNVSDHSTSDRQLFDSSPFLTDCIPTPPTLRNPNKPSPMPTTLSNCGTSALPSYKSFSSKHSLPSPTPLRLPRLCSPVCAFINRLLSINASKLRSGQNCSDAPTIVAIGKPEPSNFLLSLLPCSFNPPSLLSPPLRPTRQLSFTQYPGAPRNICHRFDAPAGCPSTGPCC